MKHFTPPFIGSIDQGTTSSRFIIFDSHGRPAFKSQQELLQISPKPGWTEQDPQLILSSVQECVANAAAQFVDAGYAVEMIKGIGITNQRETTVVWDKETGEALHNAIVWLDTRTIETVAKLKQKQVDSKFNLQEICGLPLSAYFSALKLHWLLENIPKVANAMHEKRLMFGTIDSWLLYKLTGTHATDVTNASRTMLMSLDTCQWDPRLLDFFQIDESCLPKIFECSHKFGVISDGVLKGIKVCGVVGDQQAALVGHKCTTPGSVKNTYGTGCFTLFNTGTKKVVSLNGLLTTVAYKMGATGQVIYALEGSVAIAGAGIKWMRDNLGIISTSDEINKLAQSVPDTAGVYFVPAFSGLLAPYWRSDAKALLTGMTLFTTKAHIARAVLESIAFQSVEVLLAMKSDANCAFTILKVDGGVTASDLCMQIQADLCGVSVQRPGMRESTALGAAIAASIGAGLYEKIEDAFPSAKDAAGIDVFESLIDERERENRIGEWKKAVSKSFN